MKVFSDFYSAVKNLIGLKSASATSDNMSDITTTSLHAKMRLILNRLSSDAFTATIQGSAHTELDTILAQLATYLSASGAAMSIQVNNNTARTNLEQALEDLLAVIGCDGANVFNPSIGGAPRTDLDAAFGAVSNMLDNFIKSPTVRKTVTFANTDADVVLFTVTGTVIVRLCAVCTTNLASSAGCDISVGVTGDLAALIPVTDCTAIDAGEIWYDAAPGSSVMDMVLMKEFVLANGVDIILDVETAAQVDSGVIEFYCVWSPLSDDGNVVAA